MRKMRIEVHFLFFPSLRRGSESQTLLSQERNRKSFTYRTHQKKKKTRNNVLLHYLQQKTKKKQ